MFYLSTHHHHSTIEIILSSASFLTLYLAVEPLALLIVCNLKLSGVHIGLSEHNVNLFVDYFILSLNKPIIALPNLARLPDNS